MAVPNSAEENLWNSISPGFRFRPFDNELITCYLENKVYGKPLPLNKIHDVELYGEYSPQELANKYEAVDKNTWYYFTKRERKYENGDRPNRTAGNGFWKATGKDEDIKNRGQVIGFKKTLAFFFGKQIEENVKSTWLMQEFRLNDVSVTEKKTEKLKSKKLLKGAATTDASQPKPKFMLDGYVLCKVYDLDKGKKPSPVVGQELAVVQHQAMEQTPIARNQKNVKRKRMSRDVIPVSLEEYPAPLQILHPVVNHEDISVPTLTSYQNNMVSLQESSVPTLTSYQNNMVSLQESSVPSLTSYQNNMVFLQEPSVPTLTSYQNMVSLQEPSVPTLTSYQDNMVSQQGPSVPSLTSYQNMVSLQEPSIPTITNYQNNMFSLQEPSVQRPQYVWPHQQGPSFQQPQYVWPHQQEPSFQLSNEWQANNFANNNVPNHMLQPDELIGSTALDNSVQPSPLQRTSSLEYFKELLDFMKSNGPNAIQTLSSNPAS